MKALTMKTLTIVAVAAAIGLAAVGVAGAQEKRKERNPELAQARKELMGTIRTYVQSNVVPQLRTWKSQLDGAMSPEDLRALNELRAKASALRKERIATVQAMRKAWHDEDYDALKRSRDRMKEIGAAMKELLAAVKPIAIEYRSTLQGIGTQAKPVIETWKKEGREIVMRWYESHKEEFGDRPMPKLGRWKIGGEFGKKVMVARFMLWDGGDFMEEIEEMAPGGEGDLPSLD